MLHRYAVCALALFCFSNTAIALELGFESLVSVKASDNVAGADKNNNPEEGQLGFVQFGVFGEQKGSKLKGGFSGEIFGTRRLDDSEADFVSITEFLGAAELQITPRSLSWYFGDILGSVRSDEGLQSIDDTDDDRRNVFATGPQFVYELDSFSRVNANILYINQTQNEVELESLFNTNASWSFDTDRGNTWGTAMTNVYTDNPKKDQGGDFNRFSLSGTWDRERGRNAYRAELGGTRYDTKDESLNGINAQIAWLRQLSSQTEFGITLSHDLRDESLNLVESLIDNGTGAEAAADGFFDETRLDLNYGLTASETQLDLNLGISHSDFRLISDETGFVTSAGSLEDRYNYSAGVSFSRVFTTQTRINTLVSYEQQDFTMRSDNTQSVLGEAQLIHRLTRSFELQLAYRVSSANIIRTRNEGDASSTTQEEIDSIENRVILGLRWAPPTRATKDLTIQMKSLLK